MQKILFICLLVFGFGLSAAQNGVPPDRPIRPPTQPNPPTNPPATPPVPLILSTTNPVLTETADINRIAALMLSWQGQSPTRTPGYEGAATRLTIISRTLSSGLRNSLSALTYGWKDCEGSFLCAGGASYYPIQIRIITGSQYKDQWQQFAVLRTLQLPLGLSLHRADTYLLTNPPKGALWLLEHPKGDYIISGALIEGTGSTAKVIRSKNLAAAIITQMNLNALLTQKGVTLWQP